jgi:hypothetical protein
MCPQRESSTNFRVVRSTDGLLELRSRMAGSPRRLEVNCFAAELLRQIACRSLPRSKRRICKNRREKIYFAFQDCDSFSICYRIPEKIHCRQWITLPFARVSILQSCKNRKFFLQLWEDHSAKASNRGGLSMIFFCFSLARHLHRAYLHPKRRR